LELHPLNGPLFDFVGLSPFTFLPSYGFGVEAFELFVGCQQGYFVMGIDGLPHPESAVPHPPPR